MATPAAVQTTQLHLATASGYTTRTVLREPARDALPSEIPIIDVSSIFGDSLTARREVAQKVRHAASNSGFFYVANHGIPAGVADRACDACLDFFRQDIAVKSKTNANNPASNNNGYRAPDTQRINANEGTDLRESYAVGYYPQLDLTVDDPASTPIDAAQYYLLEGHPWHETSNLPHFREAIVCYFQACLKLARALTRSFALSLGLPEDYFDSKVKYPEASFELNYYPPLPAEPANGHVDTADARPSIGSHTDWQLFTILWQDSNGGLQVLSDNGQWIHAPPVEGTLVVNVADYMQRMTNDKYVSAVHRARNTSGRERISMPFFWGFGLNESCGVLESCVDEGEHKKYTDIKCVDWLTLRTSYMLDVSGKLRV